MNAQNAQTDITYMTKEQLIEEGRRRHIIAHQLGNRIIGNKRATEEQWEEYRVAERASLEVENEMDFRGGKKVGLNWYELCGTAYR